MPVDLSRVLTLAQLASNALALPEHIRRQTQQADIERSLLGANAKELGISPDQVATMAPQPGLQFLNPGSYAKSGPIGGTVGKLLAGVGDVGEILSGVLGKPDEVPRVPLSELTTLANLKARRARQTTLDERTERFHTDTVAARDEANRDRDEARRETQSYRGRQEGRAGERLDLARERAGKKNRIERAQDELNTRRTGGPHAKEFKGFTDDELGKIIGTVPKNPNPLGLFLPGGGAAPPPPPTPAGEDPVNQLPAPLKAKALAIRKLVAEGKLSKDDALRKMEELRQQAGAPDSAAVQP